MSQVMSTEMNASMQNPGIDATRQLKTDFLTIEPVDGAQFRAALEQQITARANATSADNDPNKASLGERVIGRATNLASEVNKDQQYVSKMLEQASRSGDSMHLMKAMLALHDYQLRVQFISKTASKAAQSIDQLTKLQ